MREHYRGPLSRRWLPGHLAARPAPAGGADAPHADLLSFLMFAPEFSAALIELGREDVHRWIEQAHDLDDLWQLGPLSE